MNITPKHILQIKHIYSTLTGKYKDIADYILDNPEKIIRHKVREIAKDCNCDDALIIRFCQKVGYSGFTDLKTSIAADFMPVKMDIADKEFSPDDSFDKLKRNFLDNNVKVLHDTIGILEKQTVKKAVKVLSGAAKIYLLATGISGVVAEDIQIKLMRLGFDAIFHHDAEFSKIFMGLCNKEDAILAISFSGDTESICEMVSIAKKKGVPVVAVTNCSGSTLTGLSDVNLFTASDEKVFRLGAMTSRIAQYFIIDFLIVNMALENMERTEEYILRTHEMIIPKK